MIKNYRDYAYFENRPDVVQIFDDLEAYLDHCRFELLPYDPSDLYNRSSYAWRSFEKTLKIKPINNTRRSNYKQRTSSK